MKKCGGRAGLWEKDSVFALVDWLRACVGTWAPVLSAGWALGIELLTGLVASSLTHWATSLAPRSVFFYLSSLKHPLNNQVEVSGTRVAAQW